MTCISPHLDQIRSVFDIDGMLRSPLQLPLYAFVQHVHAEFAMLKFASFKIEHEHFAYHTAQNLVWVQTQTGEVWHHRDLAHGDTVLALLLCAHPVHCSVPEACSCPMGTSTCNPIDVLSLRNAHTISAAMQAD